jgi:hypothetical protein
VGSLGVFVVRPARAGRRVIAALYVETNGVYYGLPDVDPWDEARDARLYEGPWPVVAHPPCNRWCRLGARAKRGNDGGTFAAALAAVRTFGGVLEHPAHSQAWPAFNLTYPHAGRYWLRALLDDADDAWVCATDQSLFGFPTLKPTWLYYVGPNPPALTLTPADGALPGCSVLWSTKRAKTPPAFRDVLLDMARSVQVVA